MIRALPKNGITTSGATPADRRRDMKKCRHHYVNVVKIPPHPMIGLVVGIACRLCGKRISLGPSNDVPPKVQMEIRAAELAAIASDPKWQMPIGFSGDEDRGWWMCERGDDHAQTDRHLAGWLAYKITTHDEQRVAVGRARLRRAGPPEARHRCARRPYRQFDWGIDT